MTSCNQSECFIFNAQKLHFSEICFWYRLLVIFFPERVVRCDVIYLIYFGCNIVNVAVDARLRLFIYGTYNHPTTSIHDIVDYYLKLRV